VYREVAPELDRGVAPEMPGQVPVAGGRLQAPPAMAAVRRERATERGLRAEVGAMAAPVPERVLPDTEGMEPHEEMEAATAAGAVRGAAQEPGRATVLSLEYK